MSQSYTTYPTIARWLSQHFSSKHFSFNKENGEAHFPCPKCQHKSFYFNVFRGIGYCHRVGCGWKPTLADLTELTGTKPSLTSTYLLSRDKQVFVKEKKKDSIHIPPWSPIVRMDNSQLVTDYPEEFKALRGRGLTAEDMYRWGLTTTKDRIYIPVYYKGKLVQYVGRQKWWTDKYNNQIPWGGEPDLPRYKYAKGRGIGYYLLGWDEAQTWPWITIVENTFNAIWLRDKLNCVSVFGGRITEHQSDLIAKSKVNKVITLMDGGNLTNHSFYLKKKGINSKQILIVGQPDEYDANFLCAVVLAAQMHNGTYFDALPMCKEYMKGTVQEWTP